MKELRIKYTRSAGFYEELKRHVDEYFRATGRSPRDVPEVYFKTASILLWFAASYILLVFVASTWWQGGLLSISLGLAMAGIGFNVQHDGGHGAYSNRKSINRLMATSLDMLGGSSYIWKWKHNIFHHNYSNIAGVDNDIDIGPLGRLSPEQLFYRLHRFQHFYIWILYCLLPFKWQLFDDFRSIAQGKIGEYKLLRPRGWELVVLVSGKALFLCLAFVVPAMAHPLWVVLIFYAVTSLTLGFTLSVVFQLAHCVEEAVFPKPLEGTKRMEKEWAMHQVETSVDFARSNRLLTWYLGGLNFQIEHHLFPQICHFYYPALSVVIESVCAEYGIKYFAHKTMFAAIASHFRLLRMNGRVVKDPD